MDVDAKADRFVVVDRESMVGFEARRKDEFLAPLKEVLSALVRDLELHGYAWAREGKRFGDKLDALAIDSGGRVLVMEVKPGSETAALGWTPAQVARYYCLFTAWAEQDPGLAHEVLAGMLAQRVRLGLARTGQVLPPQAPPRLVPVIAVCGRVKNPREANKRMFAVDTSLRRVAGIELDDLEVWQVADDGIIATRKLGQLV